jgi:hypothetical protein
LTWENDPLLKTMTNKEKRMGIGRNPRLIITITVEKMNRIRRAVNTFLRIQEFLI